MNKPSPRRVASLAFILSLSPFVWGDMLENEERKANGTVVISTRGDNKLLVIDAATGETRATIDAGMGAHEFAVSPDGTIGVGSCYGSGQHHKTADNRLFVVDLKNRNVARTIDLGEHQRPNDLVILADNRHALCTSEVMQALLKVNLHEGKVAQTIPLDHSAGHMLAALPTGDRAYVSHVKPGGVSVIDLKAGKVEKFIETAFGAEGIAVSPDGARVWVANNRSGTISIIDTATLEVVNTIKSEGFPFRVRFTPDGTRVAISHPMSGEIKIYSAADTNLVATAEVKEAGQSLGPTSISISADSQFAFAVCEGASRLVTIDLTAAKVIATTQTGPGPDGMAWLPSTLPNQS